MNRLDLFQHAFFFNYYDSCNPEASQLILDVCNMLESGENDGIQEKLDKALRLARITNIREKRQIVAYVKKHTDWAKGYLTITKSDYEKDKKFHEQNPDVGCFIRS